MSELITTPYAEIVNDNFCRQCGRRVLLTDNFCGDCGAGCGKLIEIVDPHDSIGRSVSLQGNATQTDDFQLIRTIIHQRWAVIGIVLLMGPIGLPALWFSPRFAKTTKIIISIAYVALTIILPIAIAWYWLDYSIRPLMEVFAR